jgi:predicted Fe-Mo cluster-binding NifX family protein
MNLAITAQGTELNAAVEPRFGRAPYFLLVDSETDQFTVHDNVRNLNAPQGAGIQSAQTVARLGAEALLTGNVGPKAFATLQAAGISVYVGVTGTVAQAVEAFRAGRLHTAVEANVEGHHA